ncbi:hypothetical protein JR316_0006231 [Psilocybe cubensis]|uniref:Uncharacterized protein n=2 Tax=Psilocybe cubensis TaxID=181762 RepID=A0ACB8H1I0_PSICU|nr:hypothetical protein JR316_0006231 [Psilocybe cubensis]KAH9481704.1 hypothetical protein JR316_0006231 [Psilocybe cubensis]
MALPDPGTSSSSDNRPSTAIGPAQKHINVGTIALPGSQPDSEFPVNPLALSLSLGIVQRPPAPQPPPAAFPAHTSTNMGGDARASSSRSVEPLPPRRPPKPKKKSKKSSSGRSSKESTPQPRMPEFTLPEPGAPLPSNFLRNQENLLGMAGKVAGVNPSTLTHTNPNPHSNAHARGSTPSNPILVDDEDDTPILGRRRPPFAPGFTGPTPKSQPYIDPALLTAPTNQEIVSVLIGQKDIFPILEGVLKLVVGNVPGGKEAAEKQKSTGFRRSGPLPVQQQHYQTHAHIPVQSPSSSTTSTSSTPTSNQPNPAPPKKRRKLSRVPAGATDWDVPYPFEQGEGPEEYHTTWERERGKQLISQLIKLIKTAARKAATKKYLSQKEKEEKERKRREEEENKQRKRDVYYRVDGSAVQTQSQVHGQAQSMTHGQVYDVLQDTSNGAVGHHDLSATSTANTSAYMHSINTDQPILSLEELLGPSSTSTTTLNPSMDFSFLNSYPGGSSSLGSLEAFNNLVGSTSSSTDTNQNAPTVSTASALAGTNSETTPTMDQAAFDSWMNFLVDTFPTSFDANNNGSAVPNTTSHLNLNSNENTPPTFNPNGSASQTFDILNPSLNPSNATSHVSTPGPDDFSFASLFGAQGNTTTGGNGNAVIADYDFAAMLAAIMSPPPTAATTEPTSSTPSSVSTTAKGNTTSSDATSSTLGDDMIDPTLLALSLPSTALPNVTADANKGLNLNTNMNVDTSAPLLSLPSSSSVSSSVSSSSGVSASASGSGSISGNDPATPTSAGWDMSMPEVHMGVVGDGSGAGTQEGHGQGMWRDLMWGDFTEVAHLQLMESVDWSRLCAIGNDAPAAAMNVDDGENDFGFLPDVDEGDSTRHTSVIPLADKGKGKAVDLDPTWTPVSTLTPLSTNPNTRTSTPAPPNLPSTTASASTSTDAQAALRSLLSGPSYSSSSCVVNKLAPASADASFTPSATVSALEASRLKRKARKDDIIGRAQEKKRQLQEELNKVKIKLWETTIEQAALVHLARIVDEDEKEKERRRHAEGATDAGAGGERPVEVMSVDTGA